jgi:hypothetical protein
MEKKCEYCGNTFEAISKAKKYCSEQCRERVKHGIVLTDEEKQNIFTCKQCGIKFTSHYVKRICSKECQKLYLSEQAKRKVREKPKKVYLYNCKQCGKQFESTVKRQKYCSKGCNPNSGRKYKHDTIAKRVKERCPGFSYVDGYDGCRDGKRINIKHDECGTVFNYGTYFLTHKHQHIKCPVCAKNNTIKRLQDNKEKRELEKELKRKAKENKRALLKAQKEERALQPINKLSVNIICIDCKKEFVAGSTKALRCVPCKKKRTNRYKETHKRKRIKSNGAVDNSISLSRLMDRDKGVCALCGDSVNIKDFTRVDGVFIANDDYPSIDHIIPVSKGGTHQWGNVQLAHRKCNGKKNNSYHLYVDNNNQVCMAL